VTLSANILGVVSGEQSNEISFPRRTTMIRSDL